MTKRGKIRSRKRPDKYHTMDGLRLEVVDSINGLGKTKFSRRHALDRAKLREIEKVNAINPKVWSVWLDWSMIEEHGMSPFGQVLEEHDDIGPYRRLLKRRAVSAKAFYPECDFAIRGYIIFARKKLEETDDDNHDGWTARNAIADANRGVEHIEESDSANSPEGHQQRRGNFGSPFETPTSET